jgi:hypothetical protein
MYPVLEHPNFRRMELSKVWHSRFRRHLWILHSDDSAWSSACSPPASCAFLVVARASNIHIPRTASSAGGALPYIRDQASNATERRSRHRAQKCSVAHLLIMTISLSGPCRSIDNVGEVGETLSLGDGGNTILRSPASAGRVSEFPVSMSGTIPVRLSFPHSARPFRRLYWSIPTIISHLDSSS